MAEILVSREEVELRLPPVCICCGAPSTFWQSKRFIVEPMPTIMPTARAASLFLLMRHLANAERLTLRSCFCDEHRDHWRRGNVLLFGGLAGLLALITIGIALMVWLSLKTESSSRWAEGFFLLSVLGYAVAWGIALTLTMSKKIRAQGMADGILLQNVGDGFVAALERARQERASQNGPTPPTVPASVIEKEQEAQATWGYHMRLVKWTVGGVWLAGLVLGVVMVLVSGLSGKPAATGVDSMLAPFAKAIKPPPPADVPGKTTVDLIPLVDLGLDRVQAPHTAWRNSDNALYSIYTGGFPRVALPYRPPLEYDFIVTFAQPERCRGVYLILPNPNGGSFAWYVSEGDGWRCGFSADPAGQTGQLAQQLKSNVACTTVVQVRRDGVKALVDGKVMGEHKTNFRDLFIDDRRKLPDETLLGLSCDEPTVFHYVRVVEITGQGKKAR